MVANIYINECTTVTRDWNWRYSKDKSFEAYRFDGKTYKTYEYSTFIHTKLFWTNHNQYVSYYTQDLIYPSRSAKEKIKKILQKMAMALCKEGWTDFSYYYLDPIITSINLRGVILSGRGWAIR